MSRAVLACAMVLPLAGCHFNLPLGPRDAGQTPGGGGTTGGSSSGTGSGTGGSDAGHPVGGVLLPGEECTKNVQCFSRICGVNGKGRCCEQKCSATDPVCGATGCDGAGLCIFPPEPQTICAVSCMGRTLTTAHCNGAGQCDDSAPTVAECQWVCQDGSNCMDAGLPAGVRCNSDHECASSACGPHGEGNCCSTRCDTSDPVWGATACDDTGACIFPTQVGPGAPCTQNFQCVSGVCGIAGSGNCCAAVCDTTDPVCGATACDRFGQCVYPAPGPVVSCSGSTQVTQGCNGLGQDGPTSSPCPKGFACATATACAVTCSGHPWSTWQSGCADGRYCLESRGGIPPVCAPKLADGACRRDYMCTSGSCGAHGSGHCCAAACSTSDAQCGATDCDAKTGACIYPVAGAGCGVCTGSTSLSLGGCDGTGACGPTTDSNCASGEICDIFPVAYPQGAPACCSGPGSVLYVDSTTGVDAACCGTASPCKTLTRAMDVITHAQTTGITLKASVNGTGGDWGLFELYPVTLGWGVTLSAPGVYFSDSAGILAIFDVKAGNGDTSGYAAIEGSAAASIVIGIDSTGGVQLQAPEAVAVESGMTLCLGNAYVGGNTAYAPSGNAIQVNAGGTLMLGQDVNGATGSVTIGGDLPNGVAGPAGLNGIYCAGESGNLATVTDRFSGGLGFSSVQIVNQAGADIDAEDFCTVDLEAAPVFGTKPSGGFGTCAAKLEGAGLLVNGAATVTLGSTGGPATIQCVQGRGIDLEPTPNGTPSVLLDHVTVQNTEVGLMAVAGTAGVAATTFQFNYLGVVQRRSGSVDLTGNGGLDPNTVICSSNQESFAGATDPGIDIWNQGAKSLAADYVSWDTVGPDYFSCDLQLTSCSCNLTTCTAAGLADDMDAVEDSTALGGITTTNASQSSASCN